MAVRGVERRGAGEREARVRLVGAAVHTLVPVSRHPPSTRRRGCARRRGPSPRPARSCRSRRRPRRGRSPGGSAALVLGAVPQQRGPIWRSATQWAATGRAGGEQLLGDDVPLEVGPPVPAVLRRDDHAEPAAPASSRLKSRSHRVSHVSTCGTNPPSRDLLGEEGPHLESQLGQCRKLPGDGGEHTGDMPRLPRAGAVRPLSHIAGTPSRGVCRLARSRRSPEWPRIPRVTSGAAPTRRGGLAGARGDWAAAARVEA